MKVQTQTMEIFVKSQALNNLNEFRMEKCVSQRKNPDDPKNVRKLLAWNLQTKSLNSRHCLLSDLHEVAWIFHHKLVKNDRAHVVVIPHEGDIWNS